MRDSTPDRYVVVLKTATKTFVVQDGRAKGLFDRFRKGDQVIVRHYDVLQSVRNQKVPIETRFVDATLKP
jgi:predicted SnoaL-like aldol condensation-catalyzing enzyme